MRRRNTARGLTTGTGGLQTSGVTDSSPRAPVSGANFSTSTLRRVGRGVTVGRSGRLTTGQNWTSALNRSLQGPVGRDNISLTTPPAGGQSAAASRATCSPPPVEAVWSWRPRVPVLQVTSWSLTPPPLSWPVTAVPTSPPTIGQPARPATLSTPGDPVRQGNSSGETLGSSAGQN